MPSCIAKFSCTALVLAALIGACTQARAPAPPAVESSAGMVATSQHLASDVGTAILRQGGNAVDAAIVS
jgi:gamma-glutamyltranspeptidase/glutathione hydrolase